MSRCLADGLFRVVQDSFRVVLRWCVQPGNHLGLPKQERTVTMESLNRTKKIVGSSAVALGLALGAMGVASAASAPADAPAGETNEDETNEANETPEQEAAEDAAELELLNSFAVTPAEAEAAALKVVPGTVEEVEIEDDGATPVFEVEIIDANGDEVSVTVDPNTGVVIDQVVEGPDDDANEGPNDEVNEGSETDETPEVTDAPVTP